MRATDFPEERIAEIDSGLPLTAEERAFLVSDTANMEECSCSKAELSAMSDRELMRYAYQCWADYCR